MPHFTPRIGILDLPVEIRLMIYDLALQDSTEITISTVLDADADADANGRTRWQIPGLPDNHVPVARNGFDEKLMDFTSFAPQKWTSPPLRKPAGTPPCASSGVSTPTTIPSGLNTSSTGAASPLAQAIAAMNVSGSYFSMPAPSPPPTGEAAFSPYSLLATCQQMRDELDDHLTRRRSAHPLTLHISYPYGILVLWHLYPALLKTARTVNIAGFFTGEWASTTSHIATPNTFGVPLRAVAPQHHEVTAPNLHGPTTPSISRDTASAAPAALKRSLAALTRAGRLLPHIARVELRSFTPRSTDHKLAMYSEASPTSIAMQSVGLALLETWAWRARGGCAWVVQMRPCKKGAEGRWVSNSWPVWADGREDWMRLITGEMPLPAPMDWGLTVLD